MRSRRWLAFALAVALPLTAGACSSCPPGWVEELPRSVGWTYAAGTCAPVFVDADASQLALTRAARQLAHSLGIDVEVRLSVRQLDGAVFVEAIGDAGPTDALDELELVELVTCDGTVHALVRLPQDP